MPGGPVFIAEFIRAWAASGFASERCEVIARMCGLELRTPTLPSLHSEPSTEEPVSHTRSEERSEIEVDFDKGTPRYDFKPDEVSQIPLESVQNPPATAKRLQPRSKRESQPTSWWADLKQLPPPSAESFGEYPPPEPLFRDNWQRAILTEIAATYLPEGKPDLRATIHQIVRQRPVTRVPRRYVKSVRRGLYLLIDRGDGMRPFVADQRMLARGLEAVLGHEALAIRPFRRTPTSPHASMAHISDGPAHRQPILVVTDLGIGRPRFSGDSASASEWRRFAEDMNRAGNPVAAIVPYPTDRWPALPEQMIAIIFWDSSTNAQVVSASTRRRRRSRYHP